MDLSNINRKIKLSLLDLYEYESSLEKYLFDYIKYKFLNLEILSNDKYIAFYKDKRFIGNKVKNYNNNSYS